MPDAFSKKKRSQIMSKIKSKNTQLELDFKKMIKGLNFRHQPHVFGKPDFAIKRLKIAIFIDSCFWHKCSKHFRKPSANNFYWTQKINNNIIRARKVNAHLKKDGWKVLRVWEHDIKKNPDKRIKKVRRAVLNQRRVSSSLHRRLNFYRY